MHSFDLIYLAYMSSGMDMPDISNILNIIYLLNTTDEIIPSNMVNILDKMNSPNMLNATNISYAVYLLNALNLSHILVHRTH